MSAARRLARARHQLDRAREPADGYRRPSFRITSWRIVLGDGWDSAETNAAIAADFGLTDGGEQ